MGKPARGPKPLTVPAIVPTKNLDELWFSFLFTYPLNNKLAKINTVTEIIRCIIFGFKIDNNFTSNFKISNILDQDYEVNRNYNIPGISFFGGVESEF